LGVARSFRFQAGRGKNRQRFAPLPRSADRGTTNMSRFVVTGGAGFIGSAVVRGLLRQGARKVIVIDNLLSGREENLQEVASSVELARVDIRSYDQIAPILRGADVVFHEAAIPSVPRSIDEPVASHEVNIDGTFQVL